MIGSGGIAQACHLPGYKSIPDKCEVVAVCDTNEATAKAAAAQFDVPQVFTDYRDLLAVKGLVAVSVTTPNAFHAAPAVAALEAGKHVLCEKPLARTGAEAKTIVEAARRSKGILQVGLQFRFAGPVRFMRAYIDEGHMGDVYYARAQALRRRRVPTWGVFTNNDLQGGGPLIDIGVHILDMTLHLMGHPKPVSAAAMTWDKMAKIPGLYNAWGSFDHATYTVEDFAVGLIRFENGAAVTLESSFLANLEGSQFQTQLFGTKAGAIVKPDGDDAVKLYTEEHGRLFDAIPANVPKVASSHTDEVVAFVDAILAGSPSPVPAEQGYALNAIFDAMYRSAESGREEPVEWL